MKCNFKITYLDTKDDVFCMLKILTRHHQHEHCDGEDCIFQRIVNKK